MQSDQNAETLKNKHANFFAEKNAHIKISYFTYFLLVLVTYVRNCYLLFKNLNLEKLS